jgi:hypothetical protein
LYSQDHETDFGWASDDHENPTYEDYKLNGQYCKTGLAFPDYEASGKPSLAKCTTTDHIKFKG